MMGRSNPWQHGKESIRLVEGCVCAMVKVAPELRLERQVFCSVGTGGRSRYRAMQFLLRRVRTFVRIQVVTRMMHHSP